MMLIEGELRGDTLARNASNQRAAVYRKIIAGAPIRAAIDPFAAHVFASVLTLAVCEAAERGVSVSIGLGLGRRQLRELVDAWLPAARGLIVWAAEPEHSECSEEEGQLRSLLAEYRSEGTRETEWLICIISRRSMEPHHLWQDLGLLDRGELGRLMKARFEKLFSCNVAGMRWKKFFFRLLCESEGFTLCAAPSCQQCSDFTDCFGDEAGESQLARLRRNGPAL